MKYLLYFIIHSGDTFETHMFAFAGISVTVAWRTRLYGRISMSTRADEIDAIRTEALEANRAIVAAGLVLLTWGNASVRHPSKPIMAIKPSGVSYDALSAEKMVLVSIETGEVLEGTLRPSSDTETHRALYQTFPDIRAVIHTHSPHAVAWAQAQREIPILGTTHADHFRSAIPVTRQLTADEVDDAYEANTGTVIVETFRRGDIDPNAVPGVLVASHGPFAWGSSAAAAVENAIVLEAVAGMAAETVAVAPEIARAPTYLTEKHWLRKHGTDAYYGQARGAGGAGDGGH
jgi:L-ribulose-5-phosphate 4-epimerase